MDPLTVISLMLSSFAVGWALSHKFDTWMQRRAAQKEKAWIAGGYESDTWVNREGDEWERKL